MGCSKSSPNREVYSNTILPQETRKTLSWQPNFTPKTTGKRRTKKISRSKEIIKIWAEISKKEMKETIENINKAKSFFFEKINKFDKPLTRLIKKKRTLFFLVLKKWLSIGRNFGEHWAKVSQSLYYDLKKYLPKFYFLTKLHSLVKCMNAINWQAKQQRMQCELVEHVIKAQI